MLKTRMTLAVLALMAGTAPSAMAQIFTTTTTVGTSTTIIEFDDWGYTGPNGVGALDYQVGTGFQSSQLGQTQHVVVTGPDFKTPDAGHTIAQDFNQQNPDFQNANMDSAVNFYKWGYTTGAGSTFDNMQIDKAGNYHIAQNDMSFKFYDDFKYNDTTGANPDATYDTSINFQPYAISDAKGWCGSVLSSNPNNLEKMAGQVTFDFAFDAYLANEHQGSLHVATGDTNSAIQIVPGFVMRSYGSYTVDYADLSDNFFYTGSAVVNNTNPLTGEVDAAYQNKVSFLGAGVVPMGAWINIKAVRADGTWDYELAAEQGTDGVLGMIRADGAQWHQNSFAGYAFLMRADGMRILDYVNPTGHSDYFPAASAVPVPAAAWLMGSGLLGLAGFARRRNRNV